MRTPRDGAGSGRVQPVPGEFLMATSAVVRCQDPATFCSGRASELSGRRIETTALHPLQLGLAGFWAMPPTVTPLAREGSVRLPHGFVYYNSSQSAASQGTSAGILPTAK